MSEKRYIVGGRDGWLNIKRELSGIIIAVPEYLQVELITTKDGRDYFTILEGVERGKKFSVKSANLKNGNPGYQGSAQLQFSITKELLVYPGGQVKAVTDKTNPISDGKAHPIQIPDFPHERGMGYLAQSAYAKNWFFLGHGNASPGSDDRYLHTGRESAGCITVDPHGWTRLYQYLILSRRGDRETVGTVVVDK